MPFLIQCKVMCVKHTYLLSTKINLFLFLLVWVDNAHNSNLSFQGKSEHPPAIYYFFSWSIKFLSNVLCIYWRYRSYTCSNKVVLSKLCKTLWASAIGFFRKEKFLSSCPSACCHRKPVLRVAEQLSVRFSLLCSSWRLLLLLPGARHSSQPLGYA